jgi:hypothetical protein
MDTPDLERREDITPEENELLRTLQEAAFTYFVHKTNPTNGLVLDKSREGWPASIAAVGLALAAYPGGVECGFMTRDDAAQRTLTTLRFFANAPHGPGPDATDYKDEQHNDFVLETNLQDRNGADVANSGYLRIKRDYVSTYTDPITSTQIAVPGIILNVSKNVLRTEGIIVDALLGQGEALDEYAKNLQELEVNRREAEVTQAKTEADRRALINQLAQSNDSERAKILADLTCPCGPHRPVLDINVHSKENGPTT